MNIDQFKEKLKAIEVEITELRELANKDMKNKHNRSKLFKALNTKDELINKYLNN